MKIIYLTLVSLFLVGACHAQNEEDDIRKNLQMYIDGTSYSEPDKITAPFYEDALMFLSKKGQPIYILSAKEYAQLFEKREKGKFNGREGSILSIDIANDIATAKVEILIKDQNLRFIDLFLLKKLEGNWKIISKAATLLPN
ncbi:putative lumazine-binding protein [Flavobacteriaceae bacterium MAR_2009_75]|nr:putative lumazine-binding protein [Flavobacteriaceae bacterium MAR_2009_75]